MSSDASPDLITYGPGIPSDDELRLCGDLTGGVRALELGVSEGRNSIAFALAGAKAIAVDPDPEQIAALRADAAARELHVECHVGELADLGFATSGSVGVVVADRTLDQIDDLGRVLRQVHRVLLPSRHFVIVVRHPFHRLAHDLAAATATPATYGADGRTIGEWFTALERANFRVDAVHELGIGPQQPAPTTLILRARKEGS